jgi:hypothetical protein
LASCTPSRAFRLSQSPIRNLELPFLNRPEAPVLLMFAYRYIQNNIAIEAIGRSGGTFQDHKKME